MKDLHDEEKRVTDYATGGAKGTKLTRLGAMDPAAMIELGRVAGMGAEKYDAFNYLKGFDWSLAYNAMQRHANLFWSGEDNDPESGLSHMAHAAWMALCLVSFAMRELGTDDRYQQADPDACPQCGHPLQGPTESGIGPCHDDTGRCIDCGRGWRPDYKARDDFPGPCGGPSISDQVARVTPQALMHLGRYGQSTYGGYHTGDQTACSLCQV